MTDTRQRLLGAAADALREQGVSAISARTIAARAGVNQALVFYHFGTVTGLLVEATQASVDQAVAEYHDRFSAVTSLAELLEVGRALHVHETARGNVAQMAQVLAGAQHDPALAEAGRYAMRRWSDEVQAVVARIVAAGPLAGLVDPVGLARAVTATFVGLELYQGVDSEGAESALAALESLGALLEVIEDLGPGASRLVRARVRRGASH